ncbi:MAG: succinylglutamate desuccinylase/aspartoacylase family protein [Pseudomonadales bacterium]|nr:succinylglutamate desuccinylase/aspartoacylase family protein [Pseudomonadales bacterium]
MKKNTTLEILETEVAPGETSVIKVPISRLFGNSVVNMPVTIVNGKMSGPCLLLTAAIHGDELNGVEIIRRVLSSSWIKKLRGTLIAIPIVNVLGAVHRSRYLPDRRDLNRCFPGSPRGSLGARMANLLVKEVLPHVEFAIDLHTGAIHRSNLPQLRVHLENQQAADIANAFGVPVIVDAEIRDGSLRGAGDDMGIAIITYEAGEALRFEESAITPGVQGVRNVMTHLGMLPSRKSSRSVPEAAIAKSSSWVRAADDGFFRPHVALGDRVAKGDVLAYVSGPLDDSGQPILAPGSGIVIGRNNLPQVLEGEALFHIARFDKIGEAEKVVEAFHAQVDEQIEENDQAIIDA